MAHNGQHQIDLMVTNLDAMATNIGAMVTDFDAVPNIRTISEVHEEVAAASEEVDTAATAMAMATTVAASSLAEHEEVDREKRTARAQEVPADQVMHVAREKPTMHDAVQNKSRVAPKADPFVNLPATDATDARYAFGNYPGLRSPDDYAKASQRYKEREAEKMLMWQNTVSNQSLMDMASDLVKDAVIVRKSLLGYMGDRHMSFRETLAQNVLLVGLDKPKIRNEVYLQVMKQLSDNPKPVSRVKGWKMMHMVCKAFAPRTDLEQYVTNFLARKSAAGPPVEVGYAKYCSHTRKVMKSAGQSESWVPTLEDIKAYDDRPPNFAKFETSA